jgi:hypothetical protein
VLVPARIGVCTRAQPGQVATSWTSEFRTRYPAGPAAIVQLAHLQLTRTRTRVSAAHGQAEPWQAGPAGYRVPNTSTRTRNKLGFSSSILRGSSLTRAFRLALGTAGPSRSTSANVLVYARNKQELEKCSRTVLQLWRFHKMYTSCVLRNAS